MSQDQYAELKVEESGRVIITFPPGTKAVLPMRVPVKTLLDALSKQEVDIDLQSGGVTGPCEPIPGSG